MFWDLRKFFPNLRHQSRHYATRVSGLTDWMDISPRHKVEWIGLDECLLSSPHFGAPTLNPTFSAWLLMSGGDIDSLSVAETLCM